MRILWEKNYTRELENEIITGLISPTYFGEYIGRDERNLEPRYLRALAKMFCALLLTRFMNKAIDMVLEANEELNSVAPENAT